MRAVPEGTKIRSDVPGLFDALMRESLMSSDHDILEELFKRGVDANGQIAWIREGSDEPVIEAHTMTVVDMASKARSDVVVKGHLRTLRLLLDYGADPFVVLARGPEGSGEVTTLLHTAAFFGDEELAGFLLGKGLDPLAISVGYRNMPYRVASIMGHPRTALLLNPYLNSPN